MSRQVKKVNISGKEDKSNKVTSWSNTTTDTNYPSEKLVKDSLDGKASSTHNHTKSQITDFPTIPSASSTVPSADTTNGSYGSGTNYARSNHTHPKSSLYAESSHTHSQYLTEHQSLANYVQKSSTSGLLKNDGSVDTTQYLSSLPSHNHDDRYYTESEVDTALNGKANSSHTHTKSQITDFPSIPSKTSELTNDTGFLTSHQDISGKIDSAGTGLSKSGTTLNHSNSITALTTASFKKVKYDSQGHITGTSDVSASDLPTHTHSQYLTSHQDITGKEDSSNKVSSWSSTTTDTHYPSEKLVKDSLNIKADSIHTHTIDLNSFDFYDADNWRTIEGNAPTISSNSIQANAVSVHILNKEFLESKYYTLTFEFNTASSRNGLYLFGDMECNRKFGIVTDVGNTFVEQYDANGNATRLYDGTKNHFTSGWHDIKVIRKGNTAIVYIDEELYYTFTNIGSCTNILGLWKWSSGSVTIRNVDVSLDVTELPIDEYVLGDDILDLVYPVGSIYMSVNSTSPATLFGGTWEQIEDTFLLASGSTYGNGTTGGSADAVLVSHNHATSTSGETFVTSESSEANNTRVTYSSSGNRYVDGMTASTTPFHHRVGTGYSGVSGTGKNMPPYLAVNVWKRIA